MLAVLAAAMGASVALGEEATTARRASCPPGRLPALAVPRGVYHGAMPNFSFGERNEDYVTGSRVLSFGRHAGKRLAWAYFSQHFFRGLGFPERAVRTIWAAGAVPVVRLMPWSRQAEGQPERRFTLRSIADGGLDRDLRAWGSRAAAVGVPLVVDFGPEVNGDWFPWSGSANGAGTPGPDGPAGPAAFRRAFRRVVEDIRGGGGRTVEFAFHVEDYAQPEAVWNRAALYYPGDRYVDWVGVSIYATDGPFHSLSESLDDVYPELTRFAPSKPIAILEYGATGADGQRAKALWIRRALGALSSLRYPRVHAAAWWDERYREDARVYDYRISSSQVTLTAYRHGVRQPRFLSRPQLVCR